MVGFGRFILVGWKWLDMDGQIWLVGWLTGLISRFMLFLVGWCCLWVLPVDLLNECLKEAQCAWSSRRLSTSFRDTARENLTVNGTSRLPTVWPGMMINVMRNANAALATTEWL